MSWQECESKHIRKVSLDPERRKSIKELAIKRWDFVKTLPVKDDNISFIFDDYYEVIKELLVALMLQHGMRSKNHQCLFTFFAREYNYEAEVNVIKQMSFLRNRLEYYGEAVNPNYFKQNSKNFEAIIKLLIKQIK